MRKRYHYVAGRNSSREFIPPKDLPKDIRKKRKKPIKLFLLAVLALILVVMGYLGFSSLKAANNMLASNISVGSLIKQNSLKQTDGITNILILGKGGTNHQGGHLTDTLILARLRSKDKKAALVSIPRDLMVNIPGDGASRINEAYAQGFNTEKNTAKKNDAGIKLVGKIIERDLGVPVHYFIVVDFVGFSDLVDALGGVTVDVEKDLNDPYYPKSTVVNGKVVESEAYAPIYIKAGVQTMDGDTALKYARSRETTSDFDRAKRQQQLMFAIKEKALTLGLLSNPIRMNEVFQSLGNHIRTTFNANEIGDLVGFLKDFNQSSLISKVLDNSESGLLVSSDEGFYHLSPKTGNFNQIQQYIKDVFDTEQGSELISVEVYNGTSRSGLAGKLAETIKSSGFTVTKIENNDKMFEKTTIYDGTKSSKSYDKIKSIVGVAERVEWDQSGVIKIVIGKDYEN